MTRSEAAEKCSKRGVEWEVEPGEDCEGEDGGRVECAADDREESQAGNSELEPELEIVIVDELRVNEFWALGTIVAEVVEVGEGVRAPAEEG